MLAVLRRHATTLKEEFVQRVPVPERVAATLGALLRKMGLQLDNSRPGSCLNRQRRYSINQESARLMYAVAQRRAALRQDRPDG